MIVLKDYTEFKIMGKIMCLYTEDTCYGRNTVAEIGDIYHYLGDEQPSIATAMLAWQQINNRDLSIDERNQMLNDNIKQLGE
jgi:hypothetical protein